MSQCGHIQAKETCLPLHFFIFLLLLRLCQPPFLLPFSGFSSFICWIFAAAETLPQCKDSLLLLSSSLFAFAVLRIVPKTFLLCAVVVVVFIDSSSIRNEEKFDCQAHGEKSKILFTEQRAEMLRLRQGTKDE